MKPGKKPVVLIVDDDRWMAEQAATTLKAAGYAVLTAAHAPAAMDRIDEIQPVVLLLDILMPGASGISLLHELQSYRDTAGIPVIICSGVADSLSVDELRPYGVRRILDKTTMTHEDLVAAVRSVLL